MAHSLAREPSPRDHRCMMLRALVFAAVVGVACSGPGQSRPSGTDDSREREAAASGEDAPLTVEPPTVRGYSPGLVKEGLPPPGGAVPACHEQRRDDPAPFVLLPAAVDSIFLSCQVVAFYGYPDVPGMGTLGIGAPDQVAARVRDMAETYDSVNGIRTTVGAFHIVAAVAQGSPGADGTWLSRIPEATLAVWLEAARRHDLLVILDVQVGRSTAADELERLLPYLRDPRVHLAVDPEWAMGPGEVPGTVIGGLDASEINKAQELISQYIVAAGLPRRTLVVHQFVPGMIRNKGSLKRYPSVDLLIDTDGFGTRGQKVANYERYIAADGAPHGGFKLFFTQDHGLMTLPDVSSLVPQPDLVIYQ